MSRIYLASSWRNCRHSEVLEFVMALGHEVYNFKGVTGICAGGPAPTAFSWADIDSNWKAWTPRSYRDVVIHTPRAASGYLGDFRGMEWADTCVLLLPCGRSAHIEAGYMKGRGKRLIIFYWDDSSDGFEPDLMYLLADHIAIGLGELNAALGGAQ